MEKLNSQLSILSDESQGNNPFISLSDEEHPAEEMNVIDDDDDEMIDVDV